VFCLKVGIPAGGLFTGAEGIKNATEREIYGGLAGASYDVHIDLLCYFKLKE
jgi:aminopeptidase Y